MNPLNKFNNNQSNNSMQMINNFMQFAKNYKGNPEEEVMKLLSNGQMSQQQFQQISQQAKQIQSMLNQFGIK